MTENHGPNGLSIYCYTQACTYDKAWNDFTLIARGLVLDHIRETVVATPFPKFFNALERDQQIPNLPFEVFDKIDGSLIIIFEHRGHWYATTKRLFGSYQSRQALPLLGKIDQSLDLNQLQPGHTYLAELVGPDNQIVVRYDEPRLYLLGAYDQIGYELSHHECVELAQRAGWAITARSEFSSFAEAHAFSKSLPATQEGRVVRFENGLRLKIKGDEYCRIHATISGVTPIGVWEMMRSGDDLDETRKIIPEEFYRDFDTLRELLSQAYDDRRHRVAAVAAAMTHLSDKELGLHMDQVPEDMRRFIFSYRKQPDSPRLREAIFRSIRPDSNYISGYTPSSAMDRLSEET